MALYYYNFTYCYQFYFIRNALKCFLAEITSRLNFGTRGCVCKPLLHCFISAFDKKWPKRSSIKKIKALYYYNFAYCYQFCFRRNTLKCFPAKKTSHLKFGIKGWISFMYIVDFTLSSFKSKTIAQSYVSVNKYNVSWGNRDYKLWLLMQTAQICWLRQRNRPVNKLVFISSWLFFLITI